MCTERMSPLRRRRAIAGQARRQPPRPTSPTPPAGQSAGQPAHDSGGWALHTLLVMALGATLMSRGWLVRLAGAPADARLIAAVSAGNREQADAALADGASALARDEVGATALMHAASRGDASMVRRLLAAGAEVNAADGWRQTPLMFATTLNHVPVVRLLLQAGADPSARDGNGQTALDRCSLYNAAEAAELLARDRTSPPDPGFDPDPPAEARSPCKP